MNIVDEILKVAASKMLVESLVSEEVAKFRMDTCLACPQLSLSDYRCKVCKCYVEVKTTAEVNYNPKKLRNEITHCPRGRWGDLETANEYRKIDGLAPLTEITNSSYD